MTRATTAFSAALRQPHVKRFVMGLLDFQSGPAYWCGLPYPVVYGGRTYDPTFGLLSIDDIAETGDSSQGLKLVFSGVTAAAIAAAQTEHVQGRRCELHLAVIDAAGQLQVDEGVWIGEMDVMYAEDGDEPQLVITAEHMMTLWERAKPVLCSDAEQQAEYPGDLGCQYVAQMETANVVWPSADFFKI